MHLNTTCMNELLIIVNNSKHCQVSQNLYHVYCLCQGPTNWRRLAMVFSLTTVVFVYFVVKIMHTFIYIKNYLSVSEIRWFRNDNICTLRFAENFVEYVFEILDQSYELAMSTRSVAKSKFFAAVNLSCFVMYFNEVFKNCFLRNICHMVLPTCQKL